MSDLEVFNLCNYVILELIVWVKYYYFLVKVIDDDNYLLIGYEGDLNCLEEDKFWVFDKIC